MISSRTFTISLIKPLTLSLSIALATGLSINAAHAEAVYGPVKSSDTLSKIINRLYTGSTASRRSMMRQIVADNPSAFLNGDMNLLKLNASLLLPGSQWKNVSASVSINNKSNQTTDVQSPVDSSVKLVKADLVDRSAPSLTVEQMKGRIVFLDAERSSLIEQVAKLKSETVRLEKKVQALESNSKQSDEQLRILDAEIIRLTNLLENNESKLSNADLNQLVVLQEKFRLVQEETKLLRGELAKTQSKLERNDNRSNQASTTIANLTKENNKLQKLLRESQPGVHYYNDTGKGYELSLMSGKLQLPIALIVIGGTLLALMLTALIVTRRKKKPAEVVNESNRIDPFEITDSSRYSTLLETPSQEVRGFAQPHTQPEENVFKMFDEGTLEMDLKLDMAEAYLQVSDSDSARAILQEVMLGGSELQKRRAKRLNIKAA